MKDWAFINTSEWIRLWQAWKGDQWKSWNSPIRLDSPQAWFTSPLSARRLLAKFVRFQGRKLLQKNISQWRKCPIKILKYSLESLLQKKKNGTICKGLLTSKHLEISSSKKIFTAVHWTPSWCLKMNESEIIYALTTFIFCYLIWPGTSSPCVSTASCCCTVSCLLLCCAVCRCSCCHVRVPHTVVYPHVLCIEIQFMSGLLCVRLSCQLDLAH